MDAVTLSVLSAALASIAEEMGIVLIRAAYSSNIKERRDCSTALFDPKGRMVAQAEHIPVHLGAMPEAVAAVRAKEPTPGDVYLINDPYSGGTHLPDLTLIAVLGDERVEGYAVSRAHHSDVGGMTPGSMPASSTEVYQEGLVIPPMVLARAGEINEELLDLLLANVRTPDVRRGDLRAQLASCSKGAERLGELIDRHGHDLVTEAFDEVLNYSERRTRATLAELDDGTFSAQGALEGDGVTDDDVPIEVTVSIAGDEMEIDFTGTAGAVQGNVNCPLSVTRSACYFALRVVMDPDVPATDGTYAPLKIVAPTNSLVNAKRPSAVVAGNVETSQRIADIVLAALRQATDLPAAGQGTMNNLVIGGPDWTYYETIGGGQGAASTGPGASGVHAGMSNTLNTPVEALELEFPIRVDRYEIARGTGGAGRHRGGDGVIRAVTVLEPATLSLITDRRRHGPEGAAGGGDGTPGRNEVGGREVPAKFTHRLEAGETVVVRTPGGGGWGATAGDGSTEKTSSGRSSEPTQPSQPSQRSSQ